MNELNVARQVAENWQSLVAEVHQAARSAGRRPDEVQIIGVTKYVDLEVTAALAAAECHELAENRPQQLWQKAESEQLADSAIRWHLIGHLQSNKIRRTLRYQPMIHSVDSDRILRAIEEEATAQQREIPLLLEVNVSGDETKTGLDSEVIEPMLAAHLARVSERLARVSERGTSPETTAAGAAVRGLMAMAGWGTSVAEAQRQFAELRQLRDRLELQTGVALPELSMGMSGDFPAAIAEGATLIRIGSRLFTGVLPERGP